MRRSNYESGMKGGMEYFSSFLTLVLVMHQPELTPGGGIRRWRASTERGLGPSGAPDPRASLPSLGPSALL